MAAFLAFLEPNNPATPPTKAPTPAPIGPNAAPADAPFKVLPAIILPALTSADSA